MFVFTFLTAKWSRLKFYMLSPFISMGYKIPAQKPKPLLWASFQGRVISRLGNNGKGSGREGTKGLKKDEQVLEKRRMCCINQGGKPGRSS